MIYLDWSGEKNKWLKIERGVVFEDVVSAIDAGKALVVIPHPQQRYSHQKILIVEINGYAYMVPYIQEGEKIFLKTIIPSRKATEKYIIKSKNKRV